MKIIGFTRQEILLKVGNIFILFLLAFANSLKSENGKYCTFDSITGLEVHAAVETRPHWHGKTVEETLSYVIQNIKTPDLNRNTLPTFIVIQFVIDKNGRLIGERIRDKKHNLSEYEKLALKEISSIQNWMPGKINGINVNTIVTFPIHIDWTIYK